MPFAQWAELMNTGQQNMLLGMQLTQKCAVVDYLAVNTLGTLLHWRG